MKNPNLVLSAAQGTTCLEQKTIVPTCPMGAFIAEKMFGKLEIGLRELGLPFPKGLEGYKWARLRWHHIKPANKPLLLSWRIKCLNMQTKWQQIIAFIILIFLYAPIHAQLRIGTSTTGVNFREAPGTTSRILHTIDSSNLLVLLPREPIDQFIEVFDVETNSRGYVSEKLIQVTDTLNFGPQHFFEKSGENTSGHVEIDLINTTTHTLYVWINKFAYDIAPREKKVLVLEDEEIIYFASTPGLFPVFGKEILQKGNTYVWKFNK